jgi:plastocyanin
VAAFQRVGGLFRCFSGVARPLYARGQVIPRTLATLDEWSEVGMNGRGFLGTNATLLSDLSLVFGIGVALLLTLGVAMARRRKFAVHRWIQSSAVSLNVLQVGLIMLGSFARSAAPGIPARLGEGYYAIAAAHGLAGTVTLLFGTFVALRGNELVPSGLRFHNYKLFMRTAYGAYMTVTVLGFLLYVTWYTGAPREASPLPATQSNEVVVPMAGFAFNPDTTVVPLGGTVVWVNQDGAPHTATADDEQAFKSDLLSKGQTFRHTFDAVGEFHYFCELHGSTGGEGMAGIIKVVAADQLALVAASAPRAAPTPQPTAFVPVAQVLPRESFAAIQRLLVDGPGLPTRQGYAIGLHDQADELLRSSKLLSAAQSNNDAAGVKRHAEHIFNLIAGSRDARFGDLDGDGRSQNAGDGFGLLPNGNQAGYIHAMADAARGAEMAVDATPDIRLHAQHVQICADNLDGWTGAARDLALDLTHGPNAPAAAQLLILANRISRGDDVNGDGEIAPVPGEGGGLVAYLHAQYMAGLVPSTPYSAGAAPAATHTH